MKRAAAAALVLLAAVLWLRSRTRAPDHPVAELPMPAAPARAPAAAGLLPLSRPAPASSRTLEAPAAAPAASPDAARPALPKDPASLLDEVLAARNDNDPRLETSFNALTPAARKSFREKYRRLPPERRNQRGTIVYLLGKNLSAPEDWAFLREVAAEPPCLSLADCGKAAPAENGTEDSADEVTLAYPALVALVQAERVLAAGGPARGEALSVVRAAKGSSVPAVVEAASRLDGR